MRTEEAIRAKLIDLLRSYNAKSAEIGLLQRGGFSGFDPDPEESRAELERKSLALSAEAEGFKQAAASIGWVLELDNVQWSRMRERSRK